MTEIDGLDIESMPGYGYSGKPRETGCGPARIDQYVNQWQRSYRFG